ncbi:MAG: helix-turn-helix domain-containing protein [Bacteroidota bacterium]
MSTFLNNYGYCIQMKPLLVFLLISPLYLCAQVMQAEYASVPKLIDGLSEDWQTERAQEYVQQNHTTHDPNVLFSMLEWDEQYLYVLCMVKDKHLVQVHKGENAPYLYLNDAFEFYIDPLNDSKSRMDINDYQFIITLNNDHSILKGDKRLIEDKDNLAPKELGIATIVFQSAVACIGKVNDEDTEDSMYCVEMAIPWSGIGVNARSGHLFRADFCVDDLDSVVNMSLLADTAEVPSFFYSSWKGSRDFSFPDQWVGIKLQGEPGVFTSLSKKYSRIWLLLFFSSVAFSISWILFLLYRIRQLKNVPVRQALEPAMSSVVHPQPEEQPVTRTSPVVEKARLHIINNLGQSLSTETLADHLAMSPRQLQRVFKEELNTTPLSFVIAIKMEEAMKLLSSGDKNISEIAYALGFNDPSYFSRVFKKYFNHSPSEVLSQQQLK